MLFNTSQTQQLTGLRREQFRHWRHVLRPLDGRDGRSDQYSFSEVVALAILGILVNRVGIAVSHLKPCAEDLFGLIEEHEEVQGLPAMLFFAGDGRLSRERPDADAYVVVMVEPIVARVKELLTPKPKTQLSLDLK